MGYRRSRVEADGKPYRLVERDLLAPHHAFEDILVTAGGSRQAAMPCRRAQHSGRDCQTLLVYPAVVVFIGW